MPDTNINTQFMSSVTSRPNTDKEIAPNTVPRPVAKLDKSPSTVVELPPTERVHTAAKSAETILAFVEGRLSALREQGASEDELEVALRQASRGFAEGVDEAVDILKSMRLFSEQIAAGVAETRQLVGAGLDELSEKFLGRRIEFDENSVADPRLEVLAQSESSQRFSLNLEIETAEGDRLQIFIDQAQQSIEQIQRNLDGSEDRYWEVDWSKSISLFFSGDLSGSEREAITDFLDSVKTAVSEFAAGGMLESLQSVMAGFGRNSELGSVTVNMSQSSKFSAIQRYQSVASMSPKADSLQGGSQALVDALAFKSVINNPLKMIQSIAKNPELLLGNI